MGGAENGLSTKNPIAGGTIRRFGRVDQGQQAWVDGGLPQLGRSIPVFEARQTGIGSTGSTANRCPGSPSEFPAGYNGEGEEGAVVVRWRRLESPFAGRPKTA